MTHFGILCFPELGHLNPMIALGRELQRRGHNVTFFQIPDGQQKVLSAEMNCQLIGQSEFPLGSTFQLKTEWRKLMGISGVCYAIKSYLQRLAVITLREGPNAITAARVDVLLVDQLMFEGGTVAEFLGIPFITVCNSLLMNVEASIPPYIMPWSYNTSRWAYWRNQLGHYLMHHYFAQPILKLVNEYRRQWQLLPHSKLNDPYSKLAQVSQQPAEFEFPRRTLPPYFHFTGPFIDSSTRNPISFPFEKLTEQPLIYASLGTLLNGQMKIFQTIAEVCARLDVQLVIALGRSEDLDSLTEFAGSPLVVASAPQLELLRRAAIVITHAGLNTVLESLSNGVPLVAIPISNDQPAVAARIAWTGVGEVVPLTQLSTSRLETAIQQVLTNDFYRKNASRLQVAIRRSGGVSRAAEIIEQTISPKKSEISAETLTPKELVKTHLRCLTTWHF
ncbi:MAG: glycosyltransferase [Pleurocapsa sp. MO_192.B19]|nr:glycosyltransferase [Pleurocapsa sp. MO_192.B19]